MTLYAESSAVLGWLLGESGEAAVRHGLQAADTVVTSDLTLVECERTLIRAVTTGQMNEAEAASRKAALARAAAHWVVLHLTQEMLERARRPFPAEPVRTLDAIHLAAALVARSAVPDLQLLSLDDWIRENAQGLGFELLPRA